MTARDHVGQAKEVTIEGCNELREGGLIVLSDGSQQRRRLSATHLGSPVHIPQMRGVLIAFHVQASSGRIRSGQPNDQGAASVAGGPLLAGAH
jgi:hypothetical protein